MNSFNSVWLITSGSDTAGTSQWLSKLVQHVNPLSVHQPGMDLVLVEKKRMFQSRCGLNELSFLAAAT